MNEDFIKLEYAKQLKMEFMALYSWDRNILIEIKDISISNKYIHCTIIVNSDSVFFDEIEYTKYPLIVSGLKVISFIDKHKVEFSLCSDSKTELFRKIVGIYN